MVWLLILPGSPDHSLKLSAIAADNGPDEAVREEVFLAFRHRGVDEQVVTAIMYRDRIYLPVSELFDLLGIYYQTDAGQLLLSGHYLEPDRKFRLDFSQFRVSIKDETFNFSIDEMFVDEMDFYMDPELFSKIFNMDFQIDLSNLFLRLQSPETMPVVRRFERREQRARMELGIPYLEFYSEEFERRRSLLGGGFLDYSLTANISDRPNNYNYSGALGMEVLGGDLQGGLFGVWTETTSSVTTSNMRWRYVFDDQPWLTQLYVGQHYSEGLQSRQFRGIHLTNQPIMPRRMLDDFVFHGTAPADSEVELFINNRLVDYQIVDEMGTYDLTVPMTYGSNQVRLMVYEPDGRIREDDRRIQIPFTFLPPGEFNYNVSAGRLETPLPGSQSYSDMASAKMSYGVSNWLTASLGGDYYSEIHDNRPLLYGGLSARFFDQYLTSIDIAPDALYRISTSAVYPNSASWDITYTHFTTEDAIHNVGRYDYDARANLFLPFLFSGTPFNFRLHADRQAFGSRSNNRIRTELGVRFGRLTLRSGYRDTFRYDGSERLSTDGRLTSTVTYSASRARTTPRMFRGTYFRTQLDYSLSRDKFERIDFQVSRRVLSNGWFRFSAGRDLISQNNIFEAGLTFDFNRTRSTTTARTARGSSSVRQSLRGSVGFDDYHERMVFYNRQQVGRAAASFRFFVDHNNSGTYDEGDELIHADALRLDRTGRTRLHDDGIVRVTQLQQYYKENVEINTGAIPDPFLVPYVGDFSFIADPNRFKPMDIPFYMSGVVEGMVLRQQRGEDHGLGGVRVRIRQLDGDFDKTVRTFSDGSYYTMEIPPGRYESWVDSTQLDFLDVYSDPAIMRYEVEATAEGDILEDMNFVLFDRVPEMPPDEMPVSEDLLQRLTERAANALRLFAAAQQATVDQELEKALDFIQRSLDLYETDYGLALKGSINYLLGQREIAREFWEQASQRNPDIEIPDMDELERSIIPERN